MIGNKIYFCGQTDYSYNEPKSVPQVFDCTRNTCTKLASISESARVYSMAALNGFVYFSGRQLNGRLRDSKAIIRYDVKTDQWQNVKPKNDDDGWSQLVALNDCLYSIGGYNYRNTMERYDPTTDKWQYVTSPEYYTNQASATAHNGGVYLCSQAGFEVYSPAADTWQKLTPLEDNIEDRALVSAGDRLLALGGNEEDQTKAITSVFSYDVSTGQWSQLPDMQTPRRDFKAFAVEIPSI